MARFIDGLLFKRLSLSEETKVIAIEKDATKLADFSELQYRMALELMPASEKTAFGEWLQANRGGVTNSNITGLADGRSFFCMCDAAGPLSSFEARRGLIINATENKPVIDGELVFCALTKDELTGRHTSTILDFLKSRMNADVASAYMVMCAAQPPLSIGAVATIGGIRVAFYKPGLPHAAEVLMNRISQHAEWIRVKNTALMAMK